MVGDRTLWTLGRGARRARVIARGSTQGAELVLLVDGEPRWTQLFGRDVAALAATADLKVRALQAFGWTFVEEAPAHVPAQMSTPETTPPNVEL
jgi:hypothetical protein